MEREEQQSALGRIRAEKKLQDQKQGMDYSRSQGGEFLLDKCLNMTSAAIEQAMQASIKGAGCWMGLCSRRSGLWLCVEPGASESSQD